DAPAQLVEREIRVEHVRRARRGREGYQEPRKEADRAKVWSGPAHHFTRRPCSGSPKAFGSAAAFSSSSCICVTSLTTTPPVFGCTSAVDLYAAPGMPLTARSSHSLRMRL